MFFPCIFSHNREYASACLASKSDTIDDLADCIGLKASEYKRWLKNTNNSSVSKIEHFKWYNVPNTIIAYWAGNVGALGRFHVDWSENVRYLRDRGFYVEEIHANASSPRYDYANRLVESGQEAKLHGTYYWGHGYAPYPSSGLVSADGIPMLLYSQFSLPYEMGIAIIFACDSNSGKSAIKSEIWHGYTGTLYPINTFGTWFPAINRSEWRISTYLTPGEQGTKK